MSPAHVSCCKPSAYNSVENVQGEGCVCRPRADDLCSSSDIIDRSTSTVPSCTFIFHLEVLDNVTVHFTMGARLSQPRGPAGTTEASVPSKQGPTPTPKNPFPRGINSRTIVAPVAAFTMACILFVYARTSIRAAKANAQRHRDADGGEGLSLLNEHRRRHGLDKRLEREGGTVSQLAIEAREQLMGSKKKGSGEVAEARKGRSEDEERLMAMKGRPGKRSGQDET